MRRRGKRVTRATRRWERERRRREEGGVEAKYRFEKEKRITYESALHPLFILSSVDQRSLSSSSSTSLGKTTTGPFAQSDHLLFSPTADVRSFVRPPRSSSFSLVPPPLVPSWPSNVSIRSRRAFGPRGLLICLPISTISLRVAGQQPCESATVPRIQKRVRCRAVAPSNLFFEPLACSLRFVLGEVAFVEAFSLSLFLCGSLERAASNAKGPPPIHLSR